MADHTPINPSTADRKYYSSHNLSAIDNSVPVARRGRIGDPIRTTAAPAYNANDLSTDKNYRNGGSVQSNRGQPSRQIDVPETPSKISCDGRVIPASQRDTSHHKLAHALNRPRAVKPGETRQAEGAGDVSRPIRIHDNNQIGDAREIVIAALSFPERIVFVEAVDAATEKRFRTALEISVARGEIEQTALNRVKTRLIPTRQELIKEMVGELKPPTETVDLGKGQVGMAEDIEDFGKFVRGEEGVTDTQTAVGVSTGGEKEIAPVIPMDDENFNISSGAISNPNGESSMAADPSKLNGPTIGEGPRGKSTKPIKGAAGRTGKTKND